MVHLKFIDSRDVAVIRDISSWVDSEAESCSLESLLCLEGYQIHALEKSIYLWLNDFRVALIWILSH